MPGRRVVRRRPSLLAELTDDLEPDDAISWRQRLLSLALLIVTVAALAAGVFFVITAVLARSQ